MTPLSDQAARDRFRTEWGANFAVSANAGSGKTTAISARLAFMARQPNGDDLLSKTAVVTFAKKAASQIGQRARSVLLKELSETEAVDLSPLDHLERAFFGTIHSFCLLLARRYGQRLGIHLNPTVVADSDESCWEEFLEQDGIEFESLRPEQLSAFLRHAPIEHVFELARTLDAESARRLLETKLEERPPAPGAALREQILSLPAKGPGKKNIEVTQSGVRSWCERFADGKTYLPPFVPAGQSAAVVDLCSQWMAPLKKWIAEAAGVLGAELALRYRAFRLERGIQTYADQIEAALAVLRDPETLDRIRGENWRIILDEAQDTDAQQFAVLVEITRPIGAVLGSWPGGGPGPRPGHFCMVGDGQQAIYGGRADIRNFLRHIDAFRRGDAGELLTFRVTFRAPHAVVSLLNSGLPAAFGEKRIHNVGLSVAEGAPPPLLQVGYEILDPGPGNAQGEASLFELSLPQRFPDSVEGWMAEEVRQLADYFATHGPAGVGARQWGDVCLLAPRNDWLSTARKMLERRGIKVALQTRRQRQGDNPAVAWVAGLLQVVCDPDNAFEWFGVLREVFAVSDALLAEELRLHGAFRWEEPEVHAPLLAQALGVVRPFVLRVDDEGVQLRPFVEELERACELRPKLSVVDPSGGQLEELERLLAEASAAGGEGLSLRAWHRQLLLQLDETRGAGKSEPDAINLLTSHSAKGLEWPVVIPIGLWRRVGKPPETGLRLIPNPQGGWHIYYDSGSVPADTAEARDRERLRELVRLLYVTLTRVQQHLILPWHPQFGGKQRAGASFAELWGTPELWEPLPRLAPRRDQTCENTLHAAPVARHTPPAPAGTRTPLAELPARLLPHELSAKPDGVRAARHETGAGEFAVQTSAEEAIDYGLWWHETVEFLPWQSADSVIDAYVAGALETAAAAGFLARGDVELKRLRASAAWSELNDERWTRRAELAVFAPSGPAAWIDGVMDLVLHDPRAREVWVVDWKTNRLKADETGERLLARLAQEYAPQLRAYGNCIHLLFPAQRVRLLVYSTAVGEWTEIVP